MKNIDIFFGSFDTSLREISCFFNGGFEQQTNVTEFLDRIGSRLSDAFVFFLNTAASRSD